MFHLSNRRCLLLTDISVITLVIENLDFLIDICLDIE